MESPAPEEFCDAGRRNAKPVAALWASISTNPRRKRPRPFGLRSGGRSLCRGARPMESASLIAPLLAFATLERNAGCFHPRKSGSTVRVQAMAAKGKRHQSSARAASPWSSASRRKVPGVVPAGGASKGVKRISRISKLGRKATAPPDTAARQPPAGGIALPHQQHPACIVENRARHAERNRRDQRLGAHRRRKKCLLQQRFQDALQAWN